MSFNNFDITAIEDEVKQIVKALGVSAKVYTSRPSESSPANDFVVVNVSGGTEDLKAYGECIVDVNLFTKDVDGFKNGKRLSVMQKKIADGFPASSGRMLFDTDFNVIGDTTDGFGYHARIIRIKTTIKS